MAVLGPKIVIFFQKFLPHFAWHKFLTSNYLNFFQARYTRHCLMYICINASLHFLCIFSNEIPKSFRGPRAGTGPHTEKDSLRLHDTAVHRWQFRSVTIWAPPPLIKSWPGGMLKRHRFVRSLWELYRLVVSSITLGSQARSLNNCTCCMRVHLRQ